MTTSGGRLVRVKRLLAMPEIAEALRKPMRVNNKYCVPYAAGRSTDDDETYVDMHVPRYSPTFRVSGGKLGDIWKYTDAHEKVEYAVMTKLGWPYLRAHYTAATPIERWMVEEDGGDWKSYNGWWGDKLKETEHEHLRNPPPKLYVAVYPARLRKKLERAGVEGGTNAAAQYYAQQ